MRESNTKPTGHSYSLDSPFLQERDRLQSLGSGKIPSSVHMNEGPLGHFGSATDVQALPTQYWFGDEQETVAMGVGLLPAQTYA